ncbi:MAG: hypothetical protein M1836_005499 [Candelina mexicana]|nr:MAG: hypothetical protein M1836_005499 [Candelina mexicana]
MAENDLPGRGRSTATPRQGLSSSVFSLLRSSVKGSFLKVASLHRSAFNLHKRALSGSRTPPPAYSVTRRPSDLQDVSPETESIISGQDGLSEEGRSITPSTDLLAPTETNTGIIWSYADRGIDFLNIAAKQSSAENVDDRAPAIGRPLYIHALTYLLRGLPTDMNLEEQLSIRAALPATITSTLNIEVNEQQLSKNPASSPTSQSTPPSILHRVLATGIIYLFISFHFILPYIKFWIKKAYQYDREHHITERLVSKGLTTADGVAKTSIEMYGTVCKMGDGKVGQAMDSAAAWCIAGVTGGIHEGVGEGLMIMGARSTKSHDRTQRL